MPTSQMVRHLIQVFGVCSDVSGMKVASDRVNNGLAKPVSTALKECSYGN
jgi:hypothetical protein